jgi:hypothetical protein
MDIHRKQRLALIACSTLGAAFAVLVGAFGMLDSAEQTLPIFAATFAAVSVWLTVRIVNRRERWAKWTLAVIAGLPVLYVASFGPACRLIEEGHISFNSPLWRIYSPLTKITISPNPSLAKAVVCRWASVCGGDVGLMLLVFTLETD